VAGDVHRTIAVGGNMHCAVAEGGNVLRIAPVGDCVHRLVTKKGVMHLRFATMGSSVHRLVHLLLQAYWPKALRGDPFCIW